MTKLIVDGKEIDVPPAYTLLQACEAGGAEIPRFCFHERLSIAGNCRMCLVELKGSPKPVASCAWAVRDCRPGPNGEPPEVNTKTPMVRKAREGVMENAICRTKPWPMAWIPAASRRTSARSKTSMSGFWSRPS
jgi:NADH-quinone oxidoreductase subunit G